MPVPGDIGREHADLTVGDLAGRARVLAPHPAGGPPLLEKAGLVYDQHRTRIGQGLKGIVAHQIAQRLGVPLSPAEQRLLAPGARIARRLRPHPARLAPLRPKERIQEQPRRMRRARLLEQRPDPPLHVPQRRRPQLQRRLDRPTRHP
jgi:hypothetical protein